MTVEETTSTDQGTVETTEETVETTEIESAAETAEEVVEPTETTESTETDTTEEEATTDEQETETPVERVVPAPDGYAFQEGTPDDLQKHLGEFANKNDMTQEQLDGSIKTFGKFIQDSEAASSAELKRLGEEHVKSWGDKAKTNLNLATRALEQFDPDGKLVEVLSQGHRGRHPAVLSFLQRVGETMQEGGFLKSATTTVPQKKSMASRMFPNFKD